MLPPRSNCSGCESERRELDFDIEPECLLNLFKEEEGDKSPCRSSNPDIMQSELDGEKVSYHSTRLQLILVIVHVLCFGGKLNGFILLKYYITCRQIKIEMHVYGLKYIRFKKNCRENRKICIITVISEFKTEVESFIFINYSKSCTIKK